MVFRPTLACYIKHLFQLNVTSTTLESALACYAKLGYIVSEHIEAGVDS